MNLPGPTLVRCVIESYHWIAFYTQSQIFILQALPILLNFSLATKCFDEYNLHSQKATMFFKNKRHANLAIIVLLLLCRNIWVLLSVLLAKEGKISLDGKQNAKLCSWLQCFPAASKDLHWPCSQRPDRVSLNPTVLFLPLHSLTCLYFCRKKFWQASLPVDPKSLIRRAVCWFGKACWDILFLHGLHFPHRGEENLWKLPVLPSTMFSTSEENDGPRDDAHSHTVAVHATHKLSFSF